MFFNSSLKARIAELEIHLKNSTELNNQKSYTIDTLRKDRAQLEDKVANFQKQREAVKVKRMVGLKFRALFNGVYAPTEFKTGQGPCGKNVTHFTVSRDERTLTIHQHHADESSKDFEYRLSDIDGRIEFQFENVRVYGEEAELERASRVFLARRR